jgi:anti-sigma factor ChrR (cupin superfamily)
LKAQREFFGTDTIEWRPSGKPGVSERVLSADPDDPAVLTRLARWSPGLDTTPDGAIAHDYFEEVLLLEGELTDVNLGSTFRAGDFASRPPGMAHGPYRTAPGCTMLEIRYRL